MEPLKIWHAPVQGYAEIAEDPQVKHMRSLVTVAGAGDTGAPLTLVNHPVLYDGEAAEVRLPPQQLGAQTEEVLRRSGSMRPRSQRSPMPTSSSCAADASAEPAEARLQLRSGRTSAMQPFYVKPGDSVSFAKTVGETDIYLFAGITGDFAVNHVNEQYMARSKYGKRIAHGVLMTRLRFDLLHA